MELLKEHNQLKPALETIEVGESTFDGYDPLRLDEISLLFQTGYLTIKEIDFSSERPQYYLGIPNEEVREAFLEDLLSCYSAYPNALVQILIEDMQQQVIEQDAAGFEQSLRILFANIPYELHLKNEAYYHSMLLLLMKMLGFDIHGQVMTNIGRIDAVWHQPSLTVVAEIKYSDSKDVDHLLNEAMTQIADRRYYEKYLDRQVLLLGIAFTGKDVKCCMQTPEKK
jgi:hypothetical protein